MEMKYCHQCGESKSVDNFAINNTKKDGYQVCCKPCKTAYYTENTWAQKLDKKYGVNKETYNQMLANQNGVCAICGKPETSTGFNNVVKKLAVDHCHETKKVRGLLCSLCNRGIGFFYDDVSLLDNAKNYLVGGKNDPK